MTEDINSALGIAPPSGTSAKPASTDDRTAKAITRYKEGYLHARAIDTFGGIIKVVALILGGLLLFAGFVSYGASANSFGGLGEIRAIAFAVFGILIGGIGYIVGVLVQSVGQSMKAHFDCAVNGSHFLNNDQRAEVMSLE
jgi:hypothetical protein